MTLGFFLATCTCTHAYRCRFSWVWVQGWWVPMGLRVNHRDARCSCTSWAGQLCYTAAVAVPFRGLVNHLDRQRTVGLRPSKAGKVQLLWLLDWWTDVSNFFFRLRWNMIDLIIVVSPLLTLFSPLLLSSHCHMVHHFKKHHPIGATSLSLLFLTSCLLFDVVTQLLPCGSL